MNPKLASAFRKANGFSESHRAAEKPWPKMDEDAYLGLAGEIARTIEPHSESDPVAPLIQTLVFFGSVIGPIPYYQVEADRHHANLFVLMVGNSSKARKGTSLGRVLSFFKPVDPDWADNRMKSGLSSGEGLINEVRDPVKDWDAKINADITIDQGASDKRLLVTEAEFASALSVMERQGNTLSPVLRKAWDGSKLSTMTRNSRLTATGAHVSIVGHITEAELKARLTRTEMANGLANRFLIPLVKRSKLLPHGGDTLEPSVVADLSARINDAVSYAKALDRVRMVPEAAAMWEGIYKDLSADRPGMLGAITARAEAQTVRLAMIYALLDHCDRIGEAHLQAALAIWQYCEASAVHIFADALGDPVADQIAEALRGADQDGLNRTEISGLFGRNQSAERIGSALALLQGRGLALPESRVGVTGRRTEVWIARKTNGASPSYVDGRS
jgi:hypothetical protein